MKIVEFRIVNGALLEAPVYEKHHRGKNWLAIIDVNGAMPGGLARDFVQSGRGECLYMVEQVTRFDALEFGADYVTGAGRKYPKRWYGVVVEKQRELLSLVECESGAKAVVLADDMRNGVEIKRITVEETKLKKAISTFSDFSDWIQVVDPDGKELPRTVWERAS